MVAISAARALNKSLVAQPLVAVLVAGTAGIGHFTVRGLASLFGSERQGNSLQIYILGRKQEAFNSVVQECKSICPGAHYSFVAVGDLALMKDVDRACEELKNVFKADGVDRVDLLVQTQGQVLFGGRVETSEGLDRSMALLYYSRLRIITSLLPFMLHSHLPTGGHVLSVYAAGLEGTLNPSDLSLRQPGNYSFSACRSHSVYMTNLAFDRLAAEHPGKLSLVHCFPGMIITPGYTDPGHPLWFKVIWRILGPVVVSFMAIKPDDAATRMLYLATDRFPARGTGGAQGAADGGAAVGLDGKRGSGAYAVDAAGESVKSKLKVGYEELKANGTAERVWQHTLSAWETIVSGKKFEG